MCQRNPTDASDDGGSKDSSKQVSLAVLVLYPHLQEKYYHQTLESLVMNHSRKIP